MLEKRILPVASQKGEHQPSQLEPMIKQFLKAGIENNYSITSQTTRSYRMCSLVGSSLALQRGCIAVS